ncbi:hypothetical protein M9Y10_012136 [Tritrichomonas musculus]|uniref:Uncharacterized protein n=1 Tax=Tritrichomonas musculus TaxID=1915356 RepID=A0ABR2ICB0_9EUKA
MSQNQDNTNTNEEQEQEQAQNTNTNNEQYQITQINRIINELISFRDDLQNQQQTQITRRRLNRSYPLNRSKFLNNEQRNQVLQFALNNKEQVLNQAQPNRLMFLQNMIKEQLNISISTYMTERIINIISNS